jgi:hypothetical protein
MDPNEFLAHIWEAYETGSLLTSCAWCGVVRIEGEWIPPPGGALSTIDETVTLSHSICPACLEAQLPPNDREALTRRAEPLALG